MGVLARGAVRAAFRGRGLAAAIIILMMLGTGFLAGIALDAANFERYQLNSMIDTMGHASFFGVFDERVLGLVSGESGVARAGLYYWVMGEALVNGSKVPLVLVDSRVLENPLIIAPAVPRGLEALVYTPVTGFGEAGRTVPPGPLRITVYNMSSGYWENITLNVAGTARGIPWFTGSGTLVLVVNWTLLSRVTGGHPTWLAVWCSAPRDSVIDSVASRTTDVLRSNGYAVYGVWVNHVENNPVSRMIGEMARFIEPYILAAILLVAVLSLASGMLLIVRSTREIGVLHSIGVTRRGVALFYMAPWVIRVLLGGALGSVLAPLIGKLILRLTMGRSGVLDILLGAYGFEIPLPVLLEYTGVSIMLALLGALAPGAAAARVRPVEALRFYGLRPGRALRLRLGGVLLRLALRRLFSRPWRLAGLSLSAALILGAAVGASIMSSSVYAWNNEYWGAMDYDVMMDISPASQFVAPDYGYVYNVLEESHLVVSFQSVACSYGDYMPRAGLIVPVVAVDRGEEISFKVLGGREPGPGEAVVSLSLSKLLGIGIGDTVTLRGRGGNVSLRVVGIGIDKCNNYYVWLSPRDYERVTGHSMSLDGRIVYVKTRGDPEKAMNEITAKISRDPSITVSASTASKLRERSMQSLEFFQAVTYGFAFISLLVGIGVLVSLILVDLAGHLREAGVLVALGLTRWRLALLEAADLALSLLAGLPLAVLIGLLIALYDRSVLLRAGAGYVPLRVTPGSLLGGGVIVAATVSLVAAALAVRLYLGRARMAQVLRPD